MRKYKKSLTLPKSIILGVLFSFITLLVITLVSSFVVLRFKNPTNLVPTASLVVFVLCGTVSGFSLSKLKGDGGMAFALITGLTFIFLFIIVSLILTKGRVPGMLFMNALCYLLVSAFWAFIGKKRQAKRRRR